MGSKTVAVNDVFYIDPKRRCFTCKRRGDCLEDRDKAKNESSLSMTVLYHGRPCHPMPIAWKHAGNSSVNRLFLLPEIAAKANVYCLRPRLIGHIKDDLQRTRRGFL
jgi:hypothetical protein